ncbi:39S ribosomal protein L1, mitochondrial [Centropristis striata]|uniref:39S ribosomal protein L1, mitochondrial n=1 Tax=Centropristis striata TaxID=184440 RepID=UPI0027E01812|nr:39S ribosomal protein L1, mitochondrial [Centropristis striata]
MATCTLNAWKVLAGSQRTLLRAGPPVRTPVRTLAARPLVVRTRRKKKEEEEVKEVKKKEPRVIDDTGRHKPFGKTAWTPVDDVYFLRFYPRQVHHVSHAIHLLKTFQKLDFTPQQQPVYIDLKLDMKLEKKKKVDPFVSTVHLPHPFKTEMNRVLVFTEDADEVKVALENGATVAGGTELIQQIVDEEVSADFYVAVPEILSKLSPLKNKLRKKFPKSKRDTVGKNIPKMLELFKTGHEYLVEEDCYVRTQIATLDMSNQEIEDNLKTVLLDVCSRRPADLGPFIQRALVSSRTSEAVWFNSRDLLPAAAEDPHGP